ncbi:hypothetical protein ACSS6W_006788 [Trichoderma asperelloides]|uniref:Gastric mucin-like protein n=1 Tax=Trichoderma asperellum TaxID=101201 RepID=A0A6V8QV20_TRIAP|nr:hypothetical protein TASIC1_0006066400 [Trichoderma asperellum]
MADAKMEANGNIVAFEGHPDVVSTQLRLLPTSPQILILPAVQSYIANDDSEQAFEVRSYIRKVHDALTKRHEAARCFLQGATPMNKRLAFLNGGTPSAQVLCIKAIMEHETGGDRVEAEAVYAQLARDGLAGLEDKSRIHSPVGSVGDEAMFDEELHDPITRAMRAADALDRQTANLQPGDMLDLTSSTRPRSLSLPLYGYSDGFGDATPFFLFGAHIDDDEVIEDDPPLAPGAPTFALVDYNQPSKQTQTQLDPAELPSASPSGAVKPQSRSTLGVNHDTEMLSPTTETFNIRTDDHATHGEPIIFNRNKSVSSFKGPLPRVKSLDRIYPLSAKLRDLCIPGASSELCTDSAAPRRSHSFMVASDPKPPIIRKLSYIDRRTVASKSCRPTATVDLPHDRKVNAGQSTAGIFHTHLGTDIAMSAEMQFQPILPWVEDLLVYFKDKTPNLLLSLIIKAFKTGNYPILSSSTPRSSNATLTATTSLHLPTALGQSLSNRSHETSVLSMTDDDYDPFASSEPHQPLGREQVGPIVNVTRPPTPAQTPPPCKAKENKVYEFEIGSGQTAVAIQNSLRSILSVYFPPEAEGYRQFQFSLLPEFDGLWKPVFRESEPKGSQRENSRKVDHILAIGSQQGVDKVYSSKIIKQLETIGTKSSDRQGRSGRVDFRYLLANAMQAFTALPLTNQTSDNPFTNSYLLATLLIPHLETYLALHSEIRYLLLEYPPEHLPTVLALQKLIGVEMIKVAQIVDSTNKDRLPFTQIGGPSTGAKTDAKTPNLSSRASNSEFTVSNANFLLTYTATAKDIAKFVSTVWSIQTETGDSESSSHEKKSSSKKPRPAPLDASFTKFPRSSGSFHSKPSPTSAIDSSSPGSLTLSSRPQSFIDIKTPKSDTMYSRAFSRRRLFRSDSASMTTFDHGSDDSELDLEERRLMPMFMKSTERQGNTRKALKFLGLA